MKVLLALFLFSFSWFAYSQQMDWIIPASTPDNEIIDLTTYNNKLIAGGGFTTAGGVTVNKIAQWDGVNWSALGGGIKSKNSMVYRTIVFNNQLYVAGYFDSVGAVLSKDIAKWDGANWIAIGADSSVTSFAIFNGELYVAGDFKNIGGITANHIAKWNGVTWSPLGSGLRVAPQAGCIRDLCIYQNQLYVTGRIDSAGGIACNNFARWNGSAWNSVSTGFPFSAGAMTVWNSKLIVAGSFTNSATPIKQWDGVNLTNFTSYQFPRVFNVFNSDLYVGGDPMISKWNPSTSQWQSAVGTLTVNCFSLCSYIYDFEVFNNELYCAGNFKKYLGGEFKGYIAKLTDVTAVSENSAESDQIKVFPNPCNDFLNLSLSVDGFNKCEVVNALGQSILKIDLHIGDRAVQTNLSNLPSGAYFVILSGPQLHSKVFKLLKE